MRRAITIKEAREQTMNTLKTDIETERRFTFMDGSGYGPEWSHQSTRWICHDPDGHSAGVFTTSKEAEAAVKRWNEHGGDLIRMSWVTSPDGSDDSHRGTYTIRILGTGYVKHIACGWGSMDVARDHIEKLRDAVAKHGFDTLCECLGLKPAYVKSVKEEPKGNEGYFQWRKETGHEIAQ